MSFSPLILAPLVLSQIPAAVALDQRSLGGVWSQNQYIQELNNPISCLLGCYSPAVNLSIAESPLWGLGCSWSIGEETHITLLAVTPDQQRLGIGSLLLWALLHHGLTHHQAWATLEVAADNYAALGLYQKFGFQEAGRRPKYYPSGADALILWCKMSSLTLNLDPIQQKLNRCHWHLRIDPALA